MAFSNYSIFHSGELVQKIMGEDSYLIHDNDRADGYWLRINVFMPGAIFWLPRSILMNFDSAWKELWAIRNSMVLYVDSPVVAG